MAQVTETLAAEFQSRLDRDLHINSTVNEERQLLHGWKKWQEVRKAAPYPFCRDPVKCIRAGRCTSEIVCND